MNIETALTLKVGDVVTYPPDRGAPGGVGKVTGITRRIAENLNKDKFLWVEVRTFGKSTIWPSNRLIVKERLKSVS